MLVDGSSFVGGCRAALPWPPLGPFAWFLPDLDDDVGELLGIDQPAERVDRELELLTGGNRLLADLAGGDLQVLLADGGDDVFGARWSARPASRDRARPACCNRARPGRPRWRRRANGPARRLIWIVA